MWARPTIISSAARAASQCRPSKGKRSLRMAMELAEVAAMRRCGQVVEDPSPRCATSELLAKLTLFTDVLAAFAGAESKRFSANDAARLAIVADRPESLAAKVKLAQAQLPAAIASRAREQGIFYAKESWRRKFAFLFRPGFQYPAATRL